ncbi:hypothetical protein J8V57_11175 [Xenorhabdus sp. PB61.4]|uniref:hypothetical protein n=1 Tax=Xenorhabdus sp. PB61.4 TaxID=2788940 RepID=UPI001E593232|nr:hypothetical protein [Xenorhabdus sp. PB61.4]MCC8366839.1 hypothetical protein [Xenorhabdus sp. PB61.4]
MKPDVYIGSPNPQVRADSLGGILPTLPDWLTHNPKAVISQLPWPVCSSQTTTNSTLAALTMGEFSRSLKQAGICDLGVVPIPGATVLLPWGVALSEIIATRIRTAYEAIELEEYAYPHVVAESCFEPMADLLDIERNLLRVATTIDTQSQRERGILLPTGEQVIASHWKKMINTPDVMPIRMFQRARYFRPLSSADRSGKGVFSALEAADIFEFHCCHRTPNAALLDLQRIDSSLTALSASLPLPQIVGVRPPWGNRSELYQWAIGSDTPLPSGECVQTSALYFQGQELSRRYDIGFGKGEQRQHAWQLDGFISRRVLYAQLYLSARTNGSLTVHPRLAPTQVVILVRSRHDDEKKRMQELASMLQAAGLRPVLRYCEESKALTAAQKHWRDRGVPLLLLFFGRRSANDSPRIRLLRTDKELELDQPGNSSADWLTKQVTHAITDVENDVNYTIIHQARNQISFASSEAEACQALSARQCVIAPICPTRSHTDKVASWKMGELCSFTAAPEPQPCILSGRPTWARALLSRRI